MKHSSDAQQPHEEEHANQYDRFAERARELFQAGREKSHEAYRAAVETARRQLTESGLFSPEKGQALKQYLLRDMDRLSHYRRELSDEAREKLDLARLGCGALASLSSVLHWAGDALHSLARKTDSGLLCRTGEITSAGSLTCTNCGKTIHLKKSGHIPPCPECTATHFKKGY